MARNVIGVVSTTLILVVGNAHSQNPANQGTNPPLGAQAVTLLAFLVVTDELVDALDSSIVAGQGYVLMMQEHSRICPSSVDGKYIPSFAASINRARSTFDAATQDRYAFEEEGWAIFLMVLDMLSPSHNDGTPDDPFYHVAMEIRIRERLRSMDRRLEPVLKGLANSADQVIESTKYGVPWWFTSEN